MFNEINYKRYKNKLRQLINIAENYHYQKEFDKHKSNLKKAWHVIREIISKRTVFSCSQEFLVIGKLTQNKQLIADKFNEYFTTVGSELANEIPFVIEKPDEYLDGIYKNSMFLAPATTDEIRIIIEKL